MPGQHNNATKESRSKAAIAVAEKLAKAYRSRFVGKTLPVLFEEAENGYYTGHTPNYLKVYVQAEDLHNQVLPVEITGLYKDGLSGLVKFS